MLKQQRDVQKKWTARLACSEGASDARCANCNAIVPAEPCESGYTAAGILEHIWHCVACGNQWSTSAERGNGQHRARITSATRIDRRNRQRGI